MAPTVVVAAAAGAGTTTPRPYHMAHWPDRQPCTDLGPNTVRIDRRNNLSPHETTARYLRGLSASTSEGTPVVVTESHLLAAARRWLGHRQEVEDAICRLQQLLVVVLSSPVKGGARGARGGGRGVRREQCRPALS